MADTYTGIIKPGVTAVYIKRLTAEELERLSLQSLCSEHTAERCDAENKEQS